MLIYYDWMKLRQTLKLRKKLTLASERTHSARINFSRAVKETAGITFNEKEESGRDRPDIFGDRVHGALDSLTQISLTVK